MAWGAGAGLGETSAVWEMSGVGGAAGGGVSARIGAPLGRTSIHRCRDRYGSSSSSLYKWNDTFWSSPGSAREKVTRFSHFSSWARRMSAICSGSWPLTCISTRYCTSSCSRLTTPTMSGIGQFAGISAGYTLALPVDCRR